MTVVALAATSDTRLTAGITELGLTVDGAQRGRLLAYLDLLAKWNKTYNLTAIREPERMVTHHLLDALAVLPHLPLRAGVRVLDVGSGGGVPGIPLAIARPDWHVTLVDANHKKATFLTQAAIELGLSNVEVQATRIEDYRPATSFDIVISRAFSSLADFAACSMQHVAPNGRLVAMKGVHPADELAKLPGEIVVVAAPELTIPGLAATRHLIAMERRDMNRNESR